jgi:23S rRNA (adenine1618-N6)-methyltransferase
MPILKVGLHPKNKHKSKYDFEKLCADLPALKNFVKINKFQVESIDFSNPRAVKTLNQALLKHFYQINFWDIPMGYLCPPIPGRADYLHHISDLIANKKSVRILDVGVGANCVYPLIAHSEFNWSIVGSDIDQVALENAQRIIDLNKLEHAIELRLQSDPNHFFKNIIQQNDFFDLTICNPPFHSSAEEAKQGSDKKNRNLKIKKSTLNFGGVNNELWCEGGELSFITKMINESVNFQNQVGWFSTLVSKSTTLPSLYEELKRLNISKVRTLDMAQGQKKSRILAWSFI